jgi:hypothetical protein
VTDKSIAEYLRQIGSKGGKISASRMTGAERKARAKKAVAAREANRAAAAVSKNVKKVSATTLTKKAPAKKKAK